MWDGIERLLYIKKHGSNTLMLSEHVVPRVGDRKKGVLCGGFRPEPKLDVGEEIIGGEEFGDSIMNDPFQDFGREGE